MKQWHSKKRALALTCILCAAALIGCSQATPTPKPTLAPTPVAAAPTEPPTVTPLPPPPTASVATDTPAPTITAAPTITPTLTATVTKTRAPVTPKPKASPTDTAVALKYTAPELLEPGSKDTRIEGKDDLIFRWKPVADLGKNECYAINILVINNIDQRYSPFSQIVTSTCNSAVSGGRLEFTLNRPKYAPPNYSGLVEDASKLTPTNSFTVRWSVTVVRDDGTPLSPPSAKFEFKLASP